MSFSFETKASNRAQYEEALLHRQILGRAACLVRGISGLLGTECFMSLIGLLFSCSLFYQDQGILGVFAIPNGVFIGILGGSFSLGILDNPTYVTAFWSCWLVGVVVTMSWGDMALRNSSVQCHQAHKSREYSESESRFPQNVGYP